MRKLALAAVMIAAAAVAAQAGAQQAQEESWVLVGIPGGAMGWDDRTLSIDDNGVATVSRMMYFSSPKSMGGQAFSFSIQNVTLDCLSDEYLRGPAILFDAKGVQVGASDGEEAFIDVVSGSSEDLLESSICYGDVIENTQVFETRKAAMAAAKGIALP